MGRLVSVVPSSTDIRRLIVLATCAIALAGCSLQQATPTPTPDLFSGVAQQADQSFAQGMDLYQAGRYREAQDAFNRARLFSPTTDPRIEEMIRLTNEQLTPTATPAPPTETPTPAPTAVVVSEATPYPEFSQAYFGQAFLAVVPGKDGSPVPMTRFSTQDQLGLYIEKLDERLHLAFKLRIFDANSAALVAEMTSDNVQRFNSRLVWYHTGVEAPGRFHAELYAGDVLANTFEYEVGTDPVAIPTPVPVETTTQLPAPTEQLQPQQTEQLPVVQPPQPPAPQPLPVRAPTQPQAHPQPVPTPMPPTPVPAPPPVAATATRISMPGGPSALAYVDSTDELFVADRGGLIWLLRHGEAALTRPYSVSGEPVGLAVDAAEHRMYVAVRGQPAVVVLDSSNGQQVASIALPVDPGDVRLDPSAGVLYVVLPQNDALQAIDTRSLQAGRVTTDLPGVTGLTLDASQHTLYASQLDGQIAAINVLTGDVTRRWIAGGTGLAGLAVANDQVFAVNEPEKVLIQGNLSTGEATRIDLDVEPAAVVIGPATGAVYVLGVDANMIVKFDGGTTTYIPLGDDGPAAASELSPQTAWLRPRMVTSPNDERVYVIEPEASVLAMSTRQQE